MAIVPPRICDLGENPAASGQNAVGTAAELGFSHVMSAGPEEALVQSARDSRVLAVIDIDLFERDLEHSWVRERPQLFAIQARLESRVIDPRRPVPIEGRAIARFYEDPDRFLGWWGDEIARLLNLGVSGLKFRHPERLDAMHWRELIDDARAVAPDALFVADTVGVNRDAVGKLKDAGFDYCLSSLPWWDLRAPWLTEECEASMRVAGMLACAGAPGKCPPAARQARATRLALAAITGMGTVIPFAFGQSETDDEGLDLERIVRSTNHLVESNDIVRGKGALRKLTGAGARCTALLRTDTPDIASATRALLALINPDASVTLPVAEMCAPLADWNVDGGELLFGGTGDRLAPGEARILEVQRRKSIRLPARAPARTATAAAKEARIIIANIAPSVDDGRFAAKRVAGETVTVEADIFTDGHPLVAAELRYRADDEQEWRHMPMHPTGNDRWTAAMPLERVGKHSFLIEAWLDSYGAFARDLKKKVEAQKDIGLDLEEGRKAIEEAVQHADARLATVLARFDALDDIEKVATLLAPETIALMQRLDPRRFREQSAEYAIDADRAEAVFSSWYELFPRSQTDDPHRHGTFADTIKRLPAIAAMGFDVLYMPPIHPVGTTNRKGRNNTLTPAPDDPGSVYAIGSPDGGHDAIHPELGTFDDFLKLVAAARANGLEIALDFAIQCSPDHPWIKEHHDWFDWRPDGSIKFAENPPKTYEDIVNVDFYAADAVPELWMALRNIVLFWAKAGVRVFRVDNPHTKPFAFWRWLIADVRAANPDIIFLSESFTRPKIMYQLAKLGFTQSYTYFTWRNTKEELTAYMRELTAPPVSDFFRPHFFVNTPDINPYFLQTSGRPGLLIRAALATTLSGLWGMYSGFELCESAPLPGREEYADSEKYEIKPRDWNAPGNVIAEIAQLNRLRRAEPALQTHMGLTFYNAFNPNILYYGKHAPGDASRILVAVNLNPHAAEDADFEIPLWEFGLPDHGRLAVEDLLTGAHFVWTGKMQHMHLASDAPYRIWRIAPAPEA